MKKILILFLLLLQFNFTCSQNRHRGVVWKISKDQNYCYIFGAYRIYKDKDFKICKEIINKLNDVTTYCLSVPSDSLEMEAITNKYMPLFIFKKDTTLEDMISKKLIWFLESQFESYDLTFKNFNTFKPIIMAELMTAMFYEQMNYERTNHPELYILQKAKIEDFDIIYFETVSQYYHFMENMPLYLQIIWLELALTEPYKQISSYEKSYKYWRKGDVKALEKFKKIKKYYNKELFDYYDSYIIPKYINIIKKSISSDKRVLFFFNLNQLIGDGKLIKILENEGFKIEQI